MTSPAGPRGISDEEREERGFDGPLDAIRWVQLGQRDEQGRITPNGLMIARAQADAMRARQRRQWAALGKDAPIPSIAGIDNGSWTWIGPGNIGGRTRALAINPANPQVLLAGGVAGGIWRTSDAGASWAPLDDFMANLAVTSIVYKPGVVSTVFAGTGEGFFNNDSIRGAGIFRSGDGGTTWTQLPATATSPDFLFVNRLAFSADGSVLLAANRNGVFRSLDDGASWIETLQVSVTDVRFLPGSSTAAVTAGYGRAYYSTDGGAAWTLSTGPNGPGFPNRIELGVSASSPLTVYASYAAGGASFSPPAELWRSLNGGASYSLVSAPSMSLLGNQGWYDNTVWVDPFDVNHIVVAGIIPYRSTDGGLTFDFMSNTVGVHADMHGIVSDPGYDGSGNRKVYYVNDGGIYRLEDALGGPIYPFTRLNNNYGVTQFYGGAGHPGTGRIIGGTQDNGTLVYNPSAGPQAWTQTYFADGGFAAADPTDPNYLYGETQWLGVHRSTNGGINSNDITGCGGAAPLQDSCNNNSNFIAPILLDPNDPNRLYGGGSSLWRNSSARSSSSWANVKPWTSGGQNHISAIAIAAGQPDVIWVGHSAGELYKTTNGTAGAPVWMLMNNGLPFRMATSIAIDPANTDIVWVSFGGFLPGNVWKSTNGGVTWSNAAGTGANRLPDAPVRSVIPHPINPGWVYAGTDVGVFASEDGGVTWQIPHDGPSNVAVFQLFFMNTTLVAVTHGRGMFTAPAASQPPVVTLHPSNHSVVSGGGATFSAAATGTPVPAWQWQRWDGASWVSLSDTPPYAGATTPTLTLTGASAAMSGTEYRAVASNAAGSAATNPALLTVYGAGVSVVTNGDFGAGMTGWNLFELPDIVSNITGGVFQFYKQSPTSTPSGQAAVFQHTGVSLAARAPVTASFDLGNSSTARKRITVLLLDSNFSDLHVCTFFLPAGAPLRRFEMRTHANQAWADLAVYFYAATGGSAGGYYQLDNVSVEYDPEGPTARTECVDPLAPPPPGGSPGSNLLGNGDFESGSLAPWGTFGTLTWQIAGGVFEFFKPSTTPPAGVLLQTAGPLPEGQILTATFQAGSSSTVRQRVTVLLNDADFSDLLACTFWIPPGQPLATYSMRVFTTKAWDNAMLSVYPATAGAVPWLRFDNIALQTTPDVIALGTECVEPGNQALQPRPPRSFIRPKDPPQR